MNERSQCADKRSLVRVRRGVLAVRPLLFTRGIFDIRLLGVARVILVFVGIGEGIVVSRGDRGDLNWTIVITSAEATSNDTPTDPRAQDVSKVEFDGAIGPLLELLAGVDEVLYTSGIDIATEGLSV